MKITSKDKATLQELAKKYAENAAHPANTERYQRGQDINDLRQSRPMVWIHEIPWHEMDIDGNMRLTCEDEAARGMEHFLRAALCRWQYIQADAVVEPYYYILKSFHNTGMGISIKESVVATDDKNNIASHHYKDQLDTMEKVLALKEPILTPTPDTDAAKVAFAEEILGDILPVKLRGHYPYHVPWDQIPRFRGVTEMMMGLVDTPELMHATIRRFTDFGLSMMKQMETHGLLDTNIENLHCTVPYVSGLATKEGEKTTLKNTWMRGAAQLFTEISPKMWEEFELDYVKPIWEQCGLVYYGCCEALDKKIKKLKTIPNLRKIGVSPWANAESCAEQIGPDYVYAFKPNPAHVSGNFNEEAVRQEITNIINLCKKYNCPYEFTLKDISTVTYKPQNLINWTNTVMGVIEKHY
ncbi:MAG: hypothetical protein FWC78_06055 [Defluviitaleaceae bacterium]|nr:hypothetical protein [Defluviitaleaceae bacterium]